MDKTLLDIVIVTWNSCREIGDCLRALEPLPEWWRVTIVDNRSSDETVQYVGQNFPWVRVVTNHDNVGFAAANNQVITTTDSDYVLLLNPDAVASVDAITVGLEKLGAMPSAGVLGVKIVGTDGELQPSAHRFPGLFVTLLLSLGINAILPKSWQAELVLANYWDHDKERSLDSVSGAFLIAKREAIVAAGPLSEEYFLYYEETDWCYQMWKHSYEVWFTPEITVLHHGNKSAEQRSTEWRTSLLYASKYIFCRRNYGNTTMNLIRALDWIGLSLRKSYYALPPTTQERRNKYYDMKQGQAAVGRPVGSVSFSK